jgi:signal transduction histidine kinase
LLSSGGILYAQKGLEENDDTLLFLGDRDFAPYSYYENDIPAGFSVDLMKVLSSTVYSFSSKNIKIQLLPWEECLEKMRKGEADGLIGIPLYENRRDYLNYTLPVAEIDFAIFINTDNTYVNSLRSLEGTVVAVHKECPILGELAADDKIRVLTTDTILDALKSLKNREVTAVIAEKNVALYYIQSHKIQNLKYIGKPVGRIYPYTLAVKGPDVKLLKDLDLGIKTIKENGTLAELKRKWFGRRIYEPFPWKKTVLMLSGLLLLILVLMIILWVVSLNATVNSKTRQIQMMSKKIVEKDKLAVLGKLAGQIAHELRTPLSIIHNSIFLLKKEGSENRELFEKRLRMLEEKVKLTSNILESILSYSRVKADMAKSVSVKECIEETLKDIEIPQDIEVDIQFSDIDNLFVFMDFHQLYSVFRNLILNAVQAMQDEGKLTIRVRSSVDRKKIMVNICDTGKGIMESARNKIFNLFYSSKVTGTGLGLPISKSIIEANEGSLSLEETSGKGTCFLVELPSYSAGKR